MGLFNKLKNNLNNDDDDEQQFQLSKVPGASSLNDNETDDSVESEGSPIDLAVGMGAGALVDAMTPEAAQIVGNQTGSLDLSALKKLLSSSADDAASVVNPSTSNTTALETQIKNRNIDFANRLEQQKQAARLAALQKYRQGL